MPPREVIDLSPKKRRKITVLSYGASRAGKTRFAGTFPRPLFLSDKGEGGWETMRYMPGDAFYEAGRHPEVWPIARAQEMIEAVQEIETTLVKDPDRWWTVVIDSLTFYSDSYFSTLETRAYEKSNGQQINRWAIYDMLNSHLRTIMVRVHNLGTNVVWLCLEKPPAGEEAKGGILLAGKSAQTAPARCDGLFYQQSYRIKANEPPVYEVRTKPYGAFNAGGRGFEMLPDPMEPSFRVLEEYLGIIPRVAGEEKKAKAQARA